MKYRIVLISLLLTVSAPVFANCELRQSTAVTLKMGPFVDATDGVTVEDSLDIDAADVRISKNGGNVAAKNEATDNAAYDEVGLYDIDFDATDTNTVGLLRIDIQESGAVPVWLNCIVVDQIWYDIKAGVVELITTRDTGLAILTQVDALDGSNPQTVFTIKAGGSNDDAYTGRTIHAIGGTEEGFAQITAYDGPTKEVTIEDAFPFTLEADDVIRVFSVPTPDAIENDINETGVVLQADAISSGALSDSAVDKFWDEPIADPSAVFDWSTDTMRDLVHWLGALSRNKITQTEDTKTVRNDDDDGDVATCAVDDDGTTFTRDECQ